MAVVFQKTKMLTDKPTHYCPGCTHGIIHRLVGESIEELNMQDKAIGVAPVGCAVFAYDYFNCDMMEAAHGRAPAVATGVKRALPNAIVFTYQGDGDLAAIGCGEIIHAAVRGEKITTIFVNNAIYGMTGGQMAPTSLENQVTNTSPYGRKTGDTGMPLRISELLSTIEGAAYISRVAVNTPANMTKAKNSIRKGFELQLSGSGFSLIEVLSTCPTNWSMTPLEAVNWLQENLIPYYPLGVFKAPREVDV